jgi:hypothetical protein
MQWEKGRKISSSWSVNDREVEKSPYNASEREGKKSCEARAMSMKEGVEEAFVVLVRIVGAKFHISKPCQGCGSHSKMNIKKRKSCYCWNFYDNHSCKEKTRKERKRSSCIITERKAHASLVRAKFLQHWQWWEREGKKEIHSNFERFIKGLPHVAPPRLLILGS